jgi:hypothetical protein
MEKYMKKVLLAVITFSLMLFVQACGSNSSSNNKGSIEVAFSDVPFQTEKYLRIGYTLKTWEYEKDGLELQKITVLDCRTGQELFIINKADLPKIYKDPLPENQFVKFDRLTSYYLSIQLPIPLGQSPPRLVTNQLSFRDTASGNEFSLRGGTFVPRLDEMPLVIASPIKRNNLIYMNQSTLGYHFYNIVFVNGGLFTSERYAFDSVQMNDEFTDYYEGDPTVNTNYFNYNTPLLAVADGTVVFVQDGLPENHGNMQDVVLNTLLEYGGHFVVLDIGGGHYAFYCHCIPGSIKVGVGDTVHEGEEIARLGNSGNSTGPHLHFQITDGPDIFYSYGVPFVLKEYTKIGESNGTDAPIFQDPELIKNSMMEQFTVFNME